MRIKDTFITKFRRLLNHKIFLWLILFTLGVVLYTSMYSNVKPEKLNIKKLEVAEKTIRSPITVEDVEKTEEEKTGSRRAREARLCR